MEIKHVSDFIKWVEESLDGYYPSHSALFRGECNTSYSLLPSVFRTSVNGNYIYDNYLLRSSERGLILDFIANAASYIQNIPIDQHFTWLEYAQHFGVPTRLLDWTSNPLVALYFSLSNYDTDGRVYLLHVENYEQITKETNETVLSKQSLKDVVNSMIWQEKSGIPYPIVFKPYYVDQRMSAQSSYFMVWGSKIEPLGKIITDLEKNGLGSSPHITVPSNGVYEHGDLPHTALCEIVIPKENKRNLIFELNRIGINVASVFPGLDSVGKMIEFNNNINNIDKSHLL